MAIDPYKPELAKRQTAFQIATKQLMDCLNQNAGPASQGKPEFIESFNRTLEALRDYEQSGHELSEWISHK